MKRSILLVLVMTISMICNGKYITFVTSDHTPIPGINCVGYSQTRDSIASMTSDTNGRIDVSNSGIKYVTTSHPDYQEQVVTIRNTDDETVTLAPKSSIDLSEVVVTPSDVTEFTTHTSYRISPANMRRYANVLQTLNEIPSLTVLSSGALFYEGNTNVKVLIDGVEASLQEVKTLSKEDIAKVDVYQTPPLRFIAQGVNAVIDIRLKSKLTGGNGGVDVSQAFQSLKGANAAALYYNYKRSRFSLLYDNENVHYRKIRQSEVLDYDFDGVNYNKVKDGLNSKSHLDNNSLNLAYQVNKPKNFLYQARAGFAVHRNGGTFKQNVTTRDNSFFATNHLRTDYTRYNVGNYIEKNLGKNVGTILGNINYSRFSTKYNSAYNEYGNELDAWNGSHSSYDTRFDAIFSEVQYQLPKNKLGTFAICAYENYKHSKYVDTKSPFFQTANTLGGLIQWVGRKRKVNWYVMMGADYYHTASTNLSKSYNLVIPSPIITINWRAAKKIRLTLNYSYSGNVPSIAQLSETNQWLDTKLVYHGNSMLKPYKTHRLGLSFRYNQKYVNLTVNNSFESSPDYICDMYTRTENYMLQTLVNLTKYRTLGTQIDLSIMPLGNNKLVFWNRVILTDLKGRNKEYSWNGHRFQWMSNLALNLDNWTVELFYQYPGKIVEGQLERPRAQCWSTTVLYRPQTNLSVGLELFMPFGNGFKESVRTVNNAPVHADTKTLVMDRNNMVSLKLSYNFSFGRNKNSAEPQYDNGDSDTGILHK